MKEKKLIAQDLPTFKDGPALVQFANANPGSVKTNLIYVTEDGEFLFSGTRAVRLDRNFRKLPEAVDIPDAHFEPVDDKAVLYAIARQDQISPEGMLLPQTQPIKSGNTTVIKKRYRYFIVKAGKKFCELASGKSDVELVKGDEVILADYVDGLAELPQVEDPTGYICHTFRSIHYSEIQGYVKHRK